MERTSMPPDHLSSRVLTLLFTDLEGPTALKAKKGDDTASALIAEHRNQIKQPAWLGTGRQRRNEK